MKVLVTGAAGFIGQNVVNALIDRNVERGYCMGEGDLIYGMDRCENPGLDVNGWWTGDITQPLDPIPDLDAVIHLAAIANPRECDTNPGNAFDVNVNGTHQVLKIALGSGAKKVVFSSSAHVYDIPPKYMPTDETHPLRLNNTYTTTKILGEQLCQLYWENHGLSYTTLRLFNAYGPGQQAGYFIPDMIAKAKTGWIELRGSNTTKDWIYIDDVARAFVSALDVSFVGPINIGTGVETELWQIVQQIAIETGAAYNFWDISSNDVGTTRMQCDNSRAMKVMNWEPTVTLGDGLHATLDAAKATTVPA